MILKSFYVSCQLHISALCIWFLNRSCPLKKDGGALVGSMVVSGGLCIYHVQNHVYGLPDHTLHALLSTNMFKCQPSCSAGLNACLNHNCQSFRILRTAIHLTFFFRMQSPLGYWHLVTMHSLPKEQTMHGMQSERIQYLVLHRWAENVTLI